MTIPYPEDDGETVSVFRAGELEVRFDAKRSGLDFYIGSRAECIDIEEELPELMVALSKYCNKKATTDHLLEGMQAQIDKVQSDADQVKTIDHLTDALEVTKARIEELERMFQPVDASYQSSPPTHQAW